MRDFQLPGRSPVYAGTAAAATSHPLATEAAIAILREGGNAVDAAIAAAAVLCVAEPHMTGIGGDCFAIVAEPDGRLHGLNGSGRSARAARLEEFVGRGMREIALTSIHSVTVPGAVKAWETLAARHGTLGLDRLLSRAIDLAETGCAVAPRVAWDWGRALPKLQADPGSSRHLLMSGQAPRPGDRFGAPALASTLRRIAERGSEGFYAGPVAEEIVATLRERGGLLDLEDMARVAADWVEPLTSDYRGVTVAEIPPNGQGVTTLLMLNILEHFQLSGLGANSPERVHLEIEAARLAYAHRDAAIGDSQSSSRAAVELASKELGAQLARYIDPARRLADLPKPHIPHGSDTVYLTVVDGDRRAVSFINSLYNAFGVGITTERGGVTLHNRGACFVVEPGHPNCIGPAKRPLHTIIPGMALREGKPWLTFGVMGGHYQAFGHGHLLSNLLDYGMDLQEAIDAPRVFWDEAGRILPERGLPDEVVAALAKLGHQTGRPDAPWGGAQAIMLDRGRDVLAAGSDPRKDGCALGF